MDKQVILSVAGSGKTSFIINNLDEEKRIIIISYTIGNIENIKSKIIVKFGYIPKNIVIYTYFSFLYSFCFKPLFSREYALVYKKNIKGIIYKPNPNFKLSQKNIYYFVSSNNYLYSNRISKFLMALDNKKEIFSRLEKYFDALYIDEIQDFGGNDFNFIKSFSKLNMEVIFVGDFYQHTFDTSLDGNTNKNLFSNYEVYKEQLFKSGFYVNTEILSKSYRCTSVICDFVTKELGIYIHSHSNCNNSKILEITSVDEIKRIINCTDTVKLFYKEHYKYSLYSNNWGNSKGLDCYHDICIILNQKTYKFYKDKKLMDLPPFTKNKLYVACTRSKNNVFFISEANFKKCIT